MGRPSVLLLGCGFVATPTVEVLNKAGVAVTIACRTKSKAEETAHKFEHASAFALDVTDPEALEKAVAAHDLTISLIPYVHHAAVIKAAIKSKKNVVTSSYVSPAMMQLDQAAKEAGITVMNEIGLDPGIDHLYAVKMIDEVHRAGGKIKGFWSYCGGLPAPECSDNPLGYKFSWSSRGVLLALKNEASFFENGKKVHISSADLMGTAKPWHTGYQGYSFVVYPNRDSTPYKERYNIPEADNIVRGTMRYNGFPEFIKVLVDIGYLSDASVDYLSDSSPSITWKDMTARVIGSSSSSYENLLSEIISKTQFSDTISKDRIVEGLRWIGLFSDSEVKKRGNPLDTLCANLEEKMQFGPDERDLVFLQHRFEVENADGSRTFKTSTLVENGDPNGYSAMARLVGIPCGVASLMVLDGRINQKGILAPMHPALNEPIINELRDNYGIFLVEKDL